jgi:nicotinate phosphoribosyltransferase
MVNHYKSFNINPLHKSIIFSNALDIKKAIEIKKYCNGKINCSFGIGTHLTNHFENSPALNMVIKLWSINGFPAVKFSDDVGKESGDIDAIRNMKWIYQRKS